MTEGYIVGVADRLVTEFIPSQEAAAEYVRKLCNLHQKARSLDGDASGKDILAQEALLLSGCFVRQMTQWAIDHTAGRVLNSCPRSLGLRSGKDEAVYAEVARAADNPAHEAAGHSYLVDHKIGQNPAMDRRVFAELTQAIGPAYSRHLPNAVVSALRALEFGEVTPLLERVPSREQGPSQRLWQLRMAALGHIEYRRGLGYTKVVSQEDVSVAYGVEIETFDRWKSRARDRFGKLAVDNWLHSKRSIGEFDRSQRNNSSTDHSCSEVALASDGAEYQRATPRGIGGNMDDIG